MFAPERPDCDLDEKSVNFVGKYSVVSRGITGDEKMTVFVDGDP